MERPLFYAENRQNLEKCTKKAQKYVDNCVIFLYNSFI